MNKKWIIIGLAVGLFVILLSPIALPFLLGIMAPISFYGKVVDDKDGTPIEGATAKISVVDKIYADGDLIIEV
jgi:hypothetical protein